MKKDIVKTQDIIRFSIKKGINLGAHENNPNLAEDIFNIKAKTNYLKTEDGRFVYGYYDRALSNIDTEGGIIINHDLYTNKDDLIEDYSFLFVTPLSFIIKDYSVGGGPSDITAREYGLDVLDKDQPLFPKIQLVREQDYSNEWSQHMLNTYGFEYITNLTEYYQNSSEELVDNSQLINSDEGVEQ